MKYVRNYFQETLDNPAWGYSTWYLELDDNDLPVRQITVFDNGPTRKYTRESHELSHLPLDTSKNSDFTFDVISAEDFEDLWSKS